MAKLLSWARLLLTRHRAKNGHHAAPRCASVAVCDERKDLPAFWSNGVLWSLLAGADTTDGSYTLFEELCPKGAGAPPHVHLYADEVFYVLDGEAEFLAGSVREVAGAGALIFIPRGTVHAFRVRSETARMLNLYTQAGFERLLEVTAVPAAARTLPPADLASRDIPASRRAQLFAEIGMQVVAWPDPFG